jgi:hypothetical protein
VGKAKTTKHTEAIFTAVFDMGNSIKISLERRMRLQPI